jgi:hypothetical protein
MKNKTLHKAFPIVAAAIGNRFGIKVCVGGDQAYTDGKSIQLPAYEGDDPEYQDYAWGLLAHEAAHLRYSDFELRYGDWVLRRRLCGAIEDVRIEHELAKDFPGTRLTLRTVVEKMIAKGGFSASKMDDHPANILYGYVLKSLRARVLGQKALLPLVEQTEIALADKFPKGAVIRLKGLLSEVPEGLKAESDCLILTDRILMMIQQEVEQEKQKQQLEPEPEPGQDPASAVDKSTDDTTLPEPPPVLDSLLNAGEGDIDRDVFETIKAALALEQHQVSEHVMPVGEEPFVDEQAGLKLLRKVQGESVKIRAALHGLVQAHSLQRTQLRSRGRRVDGRRLHRLVQGDAKVFQGSTVKAAPSAAIHVLLDKSKSMGCQIMDSQGVSLGTRMPIALEATLALTLAFESLVGVNPGITAFPGGDVGTVYRLLDHGQRVKQRVGGFWLSPSGNTPMTEAIWFGSEALLRCRESRKVLLVMTDGQPNDEASTLEILQRCRDSGIETVGVGLGLDVSHLFPVAITINELQELRTQLFELSKGLLLAA